MTIAADYVPLFSRFLLRRLPVIIMGLCVSWLIDLGAPLWAPEQFGESHLDLLLR
jgi:hypothetical protein